MDNKDKKGKFKTAFEKVTKTDMKKKSRIVIIFFFLVAMIFGTITNIGFAPFDFLSWLADMLILLGIQVFMIIMGEISGMDKFHEDISGSFQRNLKTYNEQFAANSNDIYRGFSQWYSKRLPDELFDKKRDYLTGKGIEYENACTIIKYLELDEVDRLANDDIFKEDNKKGRIFIAKIKPYQVDAVKFALGPEFKLDNPNASYFLTAISDKHAGLSVFELGNAYQKDIKQTRTMNRAMKLTVSTIVSAFMAALTVYDFIGSGAGATQAWMKLISRLTAAFTAFFSGGLSAKTMVKIEAKIIKNKSIVLAMYLVDLKGKVFTPKTKEEIVNEKWKEHERKEKEAASKVVTPEVLEEKQLSHKKPIEIENKSHQITKR